MAVRRKTRQAVRPRARRKPLAPAKAKRIGLEQQLAEARAQQAATAAILKVIASSPSDTQPVFDAIVKSCLPLFGGMNVALFLKRGDLIDRVAFALLPGYDDEARDMFPSRLEHGGINARAIQTGKLVQVADVMDEAWVSERTRAVAQRMGFRSLMSAPLLRDAEALGTIAVFRAAPTAFSAQQVELLKTFADQAVIAIENARLFNETKEALERQTATAEILRVIAGSPADVQPVFDAIAASAHRLLGGRYAVVARRIDNFLHLAAHTSTTPEGDASLRKLFPTPITGQGAMGKAIVSAAPVAVTDVETDETYSAAFREGTRARGMRSMLCVPMLWEGEATGVIAVTRAEAGPFADHQVGLLRAFADQAVIAIENVRLFNETKEALERQRATADVLASISGSMTDTQPVFERIVQNLGRLFSTRFAVLQLLRGDVVEMPAVDGGPEFEMLRERYPRPLDDTTVGGRAMLTRQTVHVAPVQGNPETPLATVQFARDFGFNSVIFTPMIHEGNVIGAIGAAFPEAKPFDERQVALIKTFADQAVIAIQNVRLFNETKEALERQTATAEILRVISRSPGDVQPVLEAVASSAARLCEAKDVIVLLREGDALRYRVHHGEIAPGAPLGETKGISRDWSAGRCAAEGRQVHIHDILAAPDEFPEGSRMGQHAGYRTVLMTPLLRDGVVLGVIGMRRAEVRPFEARQIELINTFADQAVIAIENVRLFNETKEALEQQTATADILKVISSSPTDTQPIFDAIVQSGLKLFSGAGVGISIVDGAELRVAATAGNLGASGVGIHLPISRESASGMAIVERRVVNIKDTEAPDAPPHARDNGRKLHVRSMTLAPMFREGEPIGAIGVILKNPGGLDDKQVKLLQTFADQAVIAIENVRLFKELQARTEALTRSVGQLTALGEVGQAISSTLDLEKVLQTIVSRAVQLTGLDGGSIYEHDEHSGRFHLRAAENIDADIVGVYRDNPIRLGEGAVGRAGATREPVIVEDVLDGSYQSRVRELLIRSGSRALLAVPLLREDHLLGALVVNRSAPGSFAPEVIELLKTFATQSAVAIQNARLYREIEEKGKQLETASRHKSDFLASMSHELRTPLNAILGFNEMILGQVYGEVPADMREPLADIQASGKHLLRLINNVLDLAKIEAGRMELALSDYSVHDTVESVRSTLRPLAAEKGLEFHATLPDDLPLAYGDSGRIAQCLMNLTGNSLKFTKTGRVEISVALRDTMLVYRVADTGVGIPPDKIGSLFTEFKQTDATIASEYGGTGLGLSISRKFVEMHGGRIWVESELGKGSAFIFEVPLRAKTT